MNLLKSYNYIKDNLNLINSINVFPVFDKDTGNNVLHTLESIKDVEVANVYIKEFVCIPERARISVEIRNKNNEMLIGDKVKGFIIIKRI